jgi:hypothetical protein
MGAELTQEEAEAEFEEQYRRATPYIVGVMVVSAAIGALLIWSVLRTER